MGFAKRWRFAAVAALASLAVACGDGSENATPTPTATVEVPAAPAEFAPVPFDESDRVYVTQVCNAFDEYDGRIQSLLRSEPTISSDPPKFLAALVPMLESLRTQIEGATPSPQLVAHHDALKRSVTVVLSGALTGKIEQVRNFDDAIAADPPPRHAQDRARSAALETPECAGNDFLFVPRPSE